MVEFQRKNSKLKFEDLVVYISPNGVIGGKRQKNNKEYILSLDNGRFEEVEKGEAFSPSWAICTKEEFNKRQQEIKANIKLNKERKENEYLPYLTEPCIEMLDLHVSEEKKGEIYGQDIEDNYYVLSEDGYFRYVDYYFHKTDKDKSCKAYEAYERKAILLKEDNAIHYDNITEYGGLILDNYIFLKTGNEDLVAVSKEDCNSIYLLSITDAQFYKVDLEQNGNELKEKEWVELSNDQAITLIKKEEKEIEEREKRFNDKSSKLSDPSWWDDPDDYYYGSDTTKNDYETKD